MIKVPEFTGNNFFFYLHSTQRARLWIASTHCMVHMQVRTIANALGNLHTSIRMYVESAQEVNIHIFTAIEGVLMNTYLQFGSKIQ
jgi:hypothetical protein